MASNLIIKRIEALERAVTPTSPPVLINVWTKILADRIKKVLPKDHDYRLVSLTFSNETAGGSIRDGSQKRQSEGIGEARRSAAR